MIFIVCLSIAVVILIITAVNFFRNNENKLLTTGAGLLFALFALFIPSESCESVADIVNTIIISIIRAMKVFGLNEDFFASEFDFGTLPLWFDISYVLVLNLLYLIAPILTFGIILSLFGNISSGIKLALSVMKDVYIFSDNNVRSEKLANDIKKHNPNAETFFYNSETSMLSVQNNTICFSSTISDINPLFLKYAKHITFFICSDDEAANLSNTSAILGIVKKQPKLVKKLEKITSDDMGIDLYFFSSLKMAGPLLNGIDNCGVRVRRINEVQNLVYNFIYENPVLKYADKNNEINIAIVGLGQYGEEYLRAAVWSGQHLDCKLNINVLDIRNVSRAFSVKYPELVNTEQLSDKDEISYVIKFFDGDIFETSIESIPEMQSVSMILVALGDDEKNFEASIYLRECFERMEISPEIHTIMSDIDFNKEDAINITNHKNEAYDIKFILPNDIFSYENIMNFKLEKMGKKMYGKWIPSDKKEKAFSDFYNYEFNYRSSIASVMFWQIRKNLGMNVEVTEENKRLEHWRWSAYMRSEGFRYSPKRSDIAKLHNLLVPYDELDDKEKDNDKFAIECVKEDE